ncbi:hypothetical protein F5B21DRAFT_507334 [Xylaria acuta]|nr:hypothetical protein F5B21DRAFT_507334 [Xylaria acuta]
MGDDILVVTFSPDATKLAAVDQNGNITLWDTVSGAMITRLSEFAYPSSRSRGPFMPEYRSTQHFTEYRAYMCDTGSPALQFTSRVADILVPLDPPKSQSSRPL